MVLRAAKATLGDKKRDGDALKEILLRGPARPIVHRIDPKSFAALASGWLARRTVAPG
jgi:hypothetical protein